MSLIYSKKNGVDRYGIPMSMSFWDPWQTFSSSTFEVSESADAYTIAADMPGVYEDDLDIYVKDNVLTIGGVRKDREKTFKKSYTLPTGADVDNISAVLEHGVLTVTVPKQPASKPKKIKVTHK